MEKRHYTIKELPESERPYEKCERLGPGALTDAELLAAVLRSGTKDKRATGLAVEILGLHPYYEGLLGICHVTMNELMRIRGIGRVKAVQILCIAELSMRLSSQKVHKKISFHTPKSIADYYMEKMRHLNLFNGKNKVIKELKVSVGTVNQTVASPREVFLEALKYEAVYLILLHNHPSGDPTPSRQDVSVTKRIKEAGELLGIYLSDHIIIGDRSYVSFKEQQLL